MSYVRIGSNKHRHVKHGCLQLHMDNPALVPSSRRRKGAKHARVSANAGSESVDETKEDEPELCKNAEESEDVISCWATQHVVMNYQEDPLKLWAVIMTQFYHMLLF